jgi:hypothetical protein
LASLVHAKTPAIYRTRRPRDHPAPEASAHAQSVGADTCGAHHTGIFNWRLQPMPGAGPTLWSYASAPG